MTGTSEFLPLELPVCVTGAGKSSLRRNLKKIYAVYAADDDDGDAALAMDTMNCK